MQQTISKNFLNQDYFCFDLDLLNTWSISCIWYTLHVKNLINKRNLQVTKVFNSQVGTSEAIRLLNKFESLQKRNYSHNNSIIFFQWLAGLIDGDGCFLLNKKGYASLEITMDVRDQQALYAIKNIYGGSIKLRSGVKAIRYRLHHKLGLLSLINDVNGHIRNPKRLLQFSKLCQKYDIVLKFPEKLTINNGWFSGFFDSDGTITINRINYQLSIAVSQKTTDLLNLIVEIFGGNIYIDNKSSTYKWYISKKENIFIIYDYFQKYPVRSAKLNRVHLIPKFYKLKEIKAHNALANSILDQSWKKFFEKWLNFENVDLD